MVDQSAVVVDFADAFADVLSFVLIHETLFVHSYCSTFIDADFPITSSCTCLSELIRTASILVMLVVIL